MKKILFTFNGVIEENILKESIKKLLDKYPIFFESPAGKINHHAYKSGLIEHTFETLKYTLTIAETSNNKEIIDRDLLIAGVILHYIGKINCYGYYNNYIEFT